MSNLKIYVWASFIIIGITLFFFSFMFLEVGNLFNLKSKHSFGGSNVQLSPPSPPELPSYGENTTLESQDSFEAQETYSQGQVLRAMAIVDESIHSINISWLNSTSGSNIYIYKKYFNGTSWGNPLAILSSDKYSYIDTNINLGERYEYKITQLPNSNREDYLASGIKVPFNNYRGKLVLIIETSVADVLPNEISNLEEDLIGDGWQVTRHYVNKTDSPPAVRSIILSDYNNDPQNVRAVFLLGHVPVPYSGDFAPDGHTDVHQGAWPADIYYGSTDSNFWTDTYVNDVTASHPENRNVPNDGKFDEYYYGSTPKLWVGRVDLYNMPSFIKNETELLRQYLNKDYNFKHGIKKVSNRALVTDGFLGMGEGFAQNGYRLSSQVGSYNVSDGLWSDLVDNDYLWGYSCAAGTTNGEYGINLYTGDYAARTYKAMFQMLFGSWFGDWNFQDDFLRAPLASPDYGLTSSWAGRPNWNFHSMALGEPIGYSMQNSVCPTLYGRGSYGGCQVHIALMGDPTLRMEYIKPASGLDAVWINSTAVKLNWTASEDNVLGYYVYKAENMSGYFSLINSNYVVDTNYSDTKLSNASSVYMVRAVKLTTSGSGTYYNPSQGIFYTLNTTYFSDNPPNVVLSRPINITTQVSSTLTFECNSTDDFNLQNISLLIWNSTNDLVYTNSKSISGKTNSTTFDYNFDYPDNFSWGCLVYDNKSQYYYTDKNTVIVNPVPVNLVPENVSPVIYLIFPEDNYSTFSTLNIFEYNVTDSNTVSSCSLIIDNESLVTSSVIPREIRQNFSITLSAKIHVWQVNCSDVFSNIGNSSRRALTVNSTPVNNPPADTGSNSGNNGNAGGSSRTGSVNTEKVTTIDNNANRSSSQNSNRTSNQQTENSTQRLNDISSKNLDKTSNKTVWIIVIISSVLTLVSLGVILYIVKTRKNKHSDFSPSSLILR